MFPKLIPYFKGLEVSQIYAGNHHSFAILTNNKLYGWGKNVDCILGYNKKLNEINESINLNDNKINLEKILVEEVNQIYCNNSLNINNKLDGHMQNNKIDDYYYPLELEANKKLLKISGSYSLLLELFDNNTTKNTQEDIYCNNNNNNNNNNNDSSFIKYISVGEYCALILTNNDQLIFYGINYKGLITYSSELDNIYSCIVTQLDVSQAIRLKAHNYSDKDINLILNNKLNKKIIKKANNINKRINFNIKINKVYTSVFNCLIVSNNGLAFIWGDGRYGQLTIDFNSDKENFNEYTSNISLINKEYMYSSTPILIEKYRLSSDVESKILTNDLKVVKASLGYNHCAIITLNNDLLIWGSNESCKLGYKNKDNDESDSPLLYCSTPTKVVINMLKNDSIQNKSSFCNENSKTFIKSISLGNNHSLCMLNNGSVYSWGNAYYGQLGLENNISRDTPTLIKNIKGSKIFACYNYSLIVNKHKDTIYCFGLIVNENYNNNNNNNNNNSNNNNISQFKSEEHFNGYDISCISVNKDKFYVLNTNNELFCYEYINLNNKLIKLFKNISIDNNKHVLKVFANYNSCFMLCLENSIKTKYNTKKHVGLYSTGKIINYDMNYINTNKDEPILIDKIINVVLLNESFISNKYLTTYFNKRDNAINYKFLLSYNNENFTDNLNNNKYIESKELNNLNCQSLTLIINNLINKYYSIYKNISIYNNKECLRKIDFKEIIQIIILINKKNKEKYNYYFHINNDNEVQNNLNNCFANLNIQYSSINNDIIFKYNVLLKSKIAKIMNFKNKFLTLKNSNLDILATKNNNIEDNNNNDNNNNNNNNQNIKNIDNENAYNLLPFENDKLNEFILFYINEIELIYCLLYNHPCIILNVLKNVKYFESYDIIYNGIKCLFKNTKFSKNSVPYDMIIFQIYYKLIISYELNNLSFNDIKFSDNDIDNTVSFLLRINSFINNCCLLSMKLIKEMFYNYFRNNLILEIFTENINEFIKICKDNFNLHEKTVLVHFNVYSIQLCSIGFHNLLLYILGINPDLETLKKTRLDKLNNNNNNYNYYYNNSDNSKYRNSKYNINETSKNNILPILNKINEDHMYKMIHTENNDYDVCNDQVIDSYLSNIHMNIRHNYAINYVSDNKKIKEKLKKYIKCYNSKSVYKKRNLRNILFNKKKESKSTIQDFELNEDLILNEIKKYIINKHFVEIYNLSKNILVSIINNIDKISSTVYLLLYIMFEKLKEVSNKESFAFIVNNNNINNINKDYLDDCELYSDEDLITLISYFFVKNSLINFFKDTIINKKDDVIDVLGNYNDDIINLLNIYIEFILNYLSCLLELSIDFFIKPHLKNKDKDVPKVLMDLIDIIIVKINVKIKENTPHNDNNYNNNNININNNYKYDGSLILTSLLNNQLSVNSNTQSKLYLNIKRININIIDMLQFIKLLEKAYIIKQENNFNESSFLNNLNLNIFNKYNMIFINNSIEYYNNSLNSKLLTHNNVISDIQLNLDYKYIANQFNVECKFVDILKKYIYNKNLLNLLFENAAADNRKDLNTNNNQLYICTNCNILLDKNILLANIYRNKYNTFYFNDIKNKIKLENKEYIITLIEVITKHYNYFNNSINNISDIYDIVDYISSTYYNITAVESETTFNNKSINDINNFNLDKNATNIKSNDIANLTDFLDKEIRNLNNDKNKDVLTEYSVLNFVSLIINILKSLSLQIDHYSYLIKINSVISTIVNLSKSYIDICKSINKEVSKAYSSIVKYKNSLIINVEDKKKNIESQFYYTVLDLDNNEYNNYSTYLVNNNNNYEVTNYNINNNNLINKAILNFKINIEFNLKKIKNIEKDDVISQKNKKYGKLFLIKKYIQNNHYEYKYFSNCYVNIYKSFNNLNNKFYISLYIKDKQDIEK